MTETNPQAEPDNPSAYALARHIADYPVSTVQAAFRYLNAPLEIEVHDKPAAAAVPASAPTDPVEPVVTVHAAPDMSPTAAEALGALVDVAKQQFRCDFQHPHPDHPCGARVSAPADRAAILREAEAALRGEGKRLTGEFNDSDILHEDGPAAAVATWGRAADLMRRLAECQECEWGVEHTEHCPYPESHNWGCGCPTDVAAAIASCPGREMTPSPCRCPCEGCKHHCAAHNPFDAASGPGRADDKTQQDETPRVVVHAVPEPGSNGISACCNRPPCEFVGERVTRDPNEVTCPRPAAVSQPGKEA
ncbi:hypothetical protein [Streptomyces sp. NPDC001422]|uniref:hypothetical protein n=1 Tax=Streptomyces sp. NPDC001422 TaxID=3364575 RepID=UPI00369D71B1